MLKKSVFFDFLNCHRDTIFEQDEDYIDWNGFLLPLDYGDAEAEYHAIRNSCAVFDASPLRKTRVHGTGAGAFFDHLLTRPVSDLATMRASYAIFCNDDGSLKDDAILFKFDDDDYLLMPSDIDHTPYFAALCEQFDIRDVTFADCTDLVAGLAIQGPLSAAVLLEMGFDGVEHMAPFEVRDYEFGESVLRISRTGFTADLGYECWIGPDRADFLVQRIESARSAMKIDVPGYGLSAVQACRLEGGFIVAGWDCSTELDPLPGFERSPYDLGLGWLVNLDGAPFIGREALLEQKKNGHAYTLRSFEIDAESAPEDGAALLDGTGENATQVGIVSCSNWSWGMHKVIGNASIRSEHASLGNAWVTIDGVHVEVTLSRGPLVTLERRNQLPAPVS